MNEEDSSKTDASIKAFVDSWIGSGKEENLCATLGQGRDYYQVQNLSEISEMRSRLSNGVVKFVIKPEAIGDIKTMLRDANVTARTVYPDLEGLAKYVRGLDLNS